jgi:hypothetical protein
MSETQAGDLSGRSDVIGVDSLAFDEVEGESPADDKNSGRSQHQEQPESRRSL